jgi:Phasin protein
MFKPEKLDIGSKAAMEACGRRIEHVREISDLWLGSVQHATDSSLQLAAQLTRCGDAAEATQLYRAWINECRDRLFADGRAASEMWLKFCRGEAELLMSAASQAVPPGLAHAAD